MEFRGPTAPVPFFFPPRRRALSKARPTGFFPGLAGFLVGGLLAISAPMGQGNFDPRKSGRREGSGRRRLVGDPPPIADVRPGAAETAQRGNRCFPAEEPPLGTWPARTPMATLLLD